MSEGLRILLIAVAAIAVNFTWQAVKTTRIAVASPERLIAELRLAQFAALLLVLAAAPYIGFAAMHDTVEGVGFDVAFAVGFFVLAASTLVRDPRQALTMLAAGFAVHALVDVTHRPGLLPVELAPRWYSVGCATIDVYLGVLCYLPILKRS